MVSENAKPYCIRVFCQKPIPELEEYLNSFLAEGAFFEEEPIWASKDNNKLALHYQTDRSPIYISIQRKGDAYFDQEIEILQKILSISRVSKGRDIVSSVLAATQNLLLLEFYREELEENDDAWEFLDLLEAHTASSFDGIIHTDDELFYDKKLKKIYRL